MTANLWAAPAKRTGGDLAQDGRGYAKVETRFGDLRPSGSSDSNMDTKTLVVGQDIYIVSGCYCQKGTVTKVTPSGVEVHNGVSLFQFDTNGKGCDGQRTFECGPWEIDDEMPVAERTALWEQAARDREANRRPKQEEIAENYTTCWDGAIRKIHEMNCNCDDCQKRREETRIWQEAGW